MNTQSNYMRLLTGSAAERHILHETVAKSTLNQLTNYIQSQNTETVSFSTENMALEDLRYVEMIDVPKWLCDELSTRIMTRRSNVIGIISCTIQPDIFMPCLDIPVVASIVDIDGTQHIMFTAPISKPWLFANETVVSWIHGIMAGIAIESNISNIHPDAEEASNSVASSRSEFEKFYEKYLI